MVKEKQITSRWDAVYLARLRTGHHWDLRTYLHRITKDTEGHVVEPICPRCLQADDDTPHLFNCVGTLAVRQELFGTVDVNLCALSEFPLQSIALARRTLLKLRYRNFPKISPWAYLGFCSNFLGLFSGGLIFGWVNFREVFYSPK